MELSTELSTGLSTDRPTDRQTHQPTKPQTTEDRQKQTTYLIGSTVACSHALQERLSLRTFSTQTVEVDHLPSPARRIEYLAEEGLCGPHLLFGFRH